MTAGDIYDVWRYANIVLAAMAGSLTLGKARYVWWYLDIQAKFLYVATISFCVSTVWGAAENLTRGLPGGPRIIIGTLPLIWAIISGMTPADPNRVRALRRMKKELDGQND